MAMVLSGSTWRIRLSMVSTAFSGQRLMNSIMLRGLGPSAPPPMATQLSTSGPV